MKFSSKRVESAAVAMMRECKVKCKSINWERCRVVLRETIQADHFLEAYSVEISRSVGVFGTISSSFGASLVASK